MQFVICWTNMKLLSSTDKRVGGMFTLLKKTLFEYPKILQGHLFICQLLRMIPI